LITANLYAQNEAGVGDGGITIPLVSGQVPATIPRVATYNNVGISLVVKWEKPVIKNSIVKRIEDLEKRKPAIHDLYSGIRVLALGDSITARTSQGNTYMERIATEISPIEYNNLALSGATLAYRGPNTIVTDTPVHTDD